MKRKCMAKRQKGGRGNAVLTEKRSCRRLVIKNSYSDVQSEKLSTISKQKSISDGRPLLQIEAKQ